MIDATQNTKLADALRIFRDSIRDNINDLDDDDYNRHPDLPNILRTCEACVDTLARIAGGNDPVGAFGAPGDWGYGTPIGDGVLAYYQRKDTA